MTNTYRNIIQLIVDEMGLDPNSLGDISIKTCIKSLLNSMDNISEDELYKELLTDHSIMTKLIEEIKVPETWFFRENEAFRYLEKYAIEFLSKNKYSKLNILSAPCSSGEEPYSIAITLHNLGFTNEQYRICAVDISNANIEKAKNGIFTKSSVRNLDKNEIDKYFVNENNKYILKNNIKNSNIEFRNLNLIKELHKFKNEEFDVIFFKNLLIYLNEKSRQYVLSHIKRILKKDGILFVGVSELNFFINNNFEAINHNLAFACKPKQKIIEQKKIIKKNIEYTSKSISKIAHSKSISNQILNNTPILERYNEIKISNIKKMMDLGNYIEAEKEIDEYIKRNMNNFELYFNKGLIKYVNRLYDLAKEFFLKSIYLEPNNYDALIYLSLIEKELGANDRAEMYRLRAEKVFKRVQK